MNKENGAFQQGVFSGDWSKYNALQSEGRYATHGIATGRSPKWLIGGMIGMLLGALGGAKGGGIVGIVSGAVIGALIFAALFMMPGLIWKAARFTIGRALKIFRHEKV